MTQTCSVRSGETVSKLAARLGVDPAALMRANGMDPALADGRYTQNRADPDRLQIGQRLTIPSATPGCEGAYSVQSGDTLNELAARWGVSLESVLAANPQFDAWRADGRLATARGARGTWDPDALRIGDSLNRPGGVSGPTDTTPTAPFGGDGSGGGSGGGSGRSAILDGIATTGASSRTARQDGLAGGVDASHTMARTDEASVMRHADRFESAAHQYDLPPALLAAIASRESRGGSALDRNGYGDAGHGFGIMQVDDRNPGLRVATRVILGLRVDTPVDANGGNGSYDDRFVVLWKDANGARHVKELDAATEPASVYYAKGYGADINGDGRKELGRLREGTLQFNAGSTSRHAQALIPASSLPVTRDTNHDNRIDANDKTTNTGYDYLFHKGGRGGYTGSAGCQTIPPAQWNDFWNALGGQQRLNYVLVNVTPK